MTGHIVQTKKQALNERVNHATMPHREKQSLKSNAGMLVKVFIHCTPKKEKIWCG